MANDNNALTRTAPVTQQTALSTPVDPRSAIAARNPEDVQRMAHAIAKSGLYGVKSTEEAMIRMATGMELGLSPMQSIRGVYVIASGGVSRPTLSADMMVGVCKMRTDLCRYFRLVESTDRRATYETQRVGDPEPVRMTYTIEQAQRAGLSGRGTWQAHPEAMLRARAASSLARAVYQDLLNGLYDPDELVEVAQPVVVAQPAARAAVETVTEPAMSPADEAMARGQEMATPAERKAFWQSIAAQAKSWPKEDRDRVIGYFRALDEDYARAQAPAEAVVVEAEVA